MGSFLNEKLLDFSVRTTILKQTMSDSILFIEGTVIRKLPQARLYPSPGKIRCQPVKQ